MKKQVIHILIAFLCSGYGYAQHTDSLKNSLLQAPSDTSKIKLLTALGYEYAFIHLDSSRQYSQEAIRLAEQIDFLKGKADALNNLAISYDIEGLYEKAISDYLEALDIYRALGDRSGLARIYNNCGMVYQSLGDTSQSLVFHTKSLALEKELGDSLGIAYSMIQVASLHLNMKNYEQALALYQSALELTTHLHDSQGLAYVHWGLGELYLNENVELSLKYAQKAYALFESDENKKGMSEVSLILGKAHLLNQNFDRSESHFLTALQLSKELEAKTVILECLISLSSLAKKQGKYDLALNYHEQYHALQDSLMKNEMTVNIKEIEAKYNFELQQQEIELLNKEKDFQATTRNVLIGVAIFSTLLLMLLYWAYLSKSRTMEALKVKNAEIEKKNEIIEIEKKNALAAVKAKADFLSVMSHEIRTPMNVVMGSIYLLMEDNPRPEQVDNLNMLRFSAENLLTLVNDILDLNKLESGKLELESVPFDLNLLVKGLSEGHENEAIKKGLKLSVDVSQDIPQHLIGDPGRLSQVLNNLINNAIKFTEQGKVNLKVKLLSKDQKKVKLKFIVTDTGIGIEKEKQASIFENFTQVNSDTTRKHGGSGLGLAIAKQILKLFDSEIKLKSEPEKGSEFSFKLKFKTDLVLEKNYIS